MGGKANKRCVNNCCAENLHFLVYISSSSFLCITAWSQWRVIGGTIIRDPNDHQESYIDEIIYNNDDDDEHTPLEEPATPLEEREVKKEAE